MEKKTINDKICILLLPVAWAFILIFCVLFSFTSHASSNASFPLPYYVDYYKPTYFTSNDIISNFESNTTYDFFYIKEQSKLNGIYPQVRVYCFKVEDLIINGLYDSSNNPVSYSDFDFTTDYVSISSRVNVPYKTYIYENNTWSYFNQYSNTGSVTNVAILGNKNINSYGFTYNYPFKVNTTITYNGDVIFTNGIPQPVIEYGHATPPDPFDNPTINSGSNHTLPREVPETPTINNYTWITYNPPTIDTTNLESLIESLIYVINYLAGWLRDNFAGEFQNLISNITGLFSYIGETLQYYGGLIISNIQNGIETFYNNMVSLFEPVFEKITEGANLFLHPFDEEEFVEQIGNSEFLNAYDELMSNSEVLNDIFDNAEERDYFSLYISFENPFADTNHRIISSEINFDWLVPLRSVYRPFLWVCTLIELFVGGARILTHVLGGKGL